MPDQPAEDLSPAIIETLDQTIPSDRLYPEEKKLLGDLKITFSEFSNYLALENLAERVEPLKVEATYLTSLAGVATFLGAVQIGFIAFTASRVGPISATQRSPVQRTIDFFSFCALAFDALGALFALITSGSLLFAASSATRVTLAKLSLNKRIKTVLDDLNGTLDTPNRVQISASLEQLVVTCEKGHKDALKLQHLFEEHLTGGDLEIICVIVVGTMFFFTSLITFIISTQPVSVWIPTTAVLGITTSILLLKHSHRHPGIWRALRRAQRG